MFGSDHPSDAVGEGSPQDLPRLVSEELLKRGEVSTAVVASMQTTKASRVMYLESEKAYSFHISPKRSPLPAMLAWLYAKYPGRFRQGELQVAGEMYLRRKSELSQLYMVNVWNFPYVDLDSLRTFQRIAHLSPLDRMGLFLPIKAEVALSMTRHPTANVPNNTGTEYSLAR